MTHRRKGLMASRAVKRDWGRDNGIEERKGVRSEGVEPCKDLMKVS